MRAAVYLRFSEMLPRYSLEYHKNRALEYCNEKGYDPIVILEMIGKDGLWEEAGKNEIIKLARENLVDVIIIPHIYTISQSVQETNRILDELKKYGTSTECMEYDFLQYALSQLHPVKKKNGQRKRSRWINSILEYISLWMMKWGDAV